MHEYSRPPDRGESVVPFADIHSTDSVDTMRQFAALLLILVAERAAHLVASSSIVRRRTR